MAAGAAPPPATNGTHPPTNPLELAISLPHTPGTRIHLRLEVLAASLMLFLTSASAEGASSSAALGSFVYAMPDHADVK
ncbi:uncharacterized protein LTR77_008241 [Saxophila tyrrhenica]|uniref:Uncharacterized protein n=1 Tax=Saxophila tyrrhenica TaxID=1690608 RepID=A0AAV9P2Q6_9PEZI|nr:hypothetical protein LTR77_008241 [Saxophila tyrrhenica]